MFKSCLGAASAETSVGSSGPVRRERRDKRHRQNDPYRTRQAAHDLDADGVSVHELQIGHAVSVDDHDRVNGAARERQDERVRHRPHHIATDGHAGIEQLPEPQGGLRA